MFKYNFENLEVWRLSLQVIKRINKITKKFPPEEKYVLTDQAKRGVFLSPSILLRVLAERVKRILGALSLVLSVQP